MVSVLRVQHPTRMTCSDFPTCFDIDEEDEFDKSVTRDKVAFQAAESLIIKLQPQKLEPMVLK